MDGRERTLNERSREGPSTRQVHRRRVDKPWVLDFQSPARGNMLEGSIEVHVLLLSSRTALRQVGL